MSEHTRNQVAEAEKIDLMRIINNMWKGAKRFWLFLIVLVVLFGGIFTVRAWRNYSPIYSASATFTISSDTSSLYSSNSYLNTRTAAQIVNTFPFILNSGILQQKVADELGMDSIPGIIQTETLGSTNMITIVVNSGNPEYAYNILQAVIKHYPEVASPVIGEVQMNLFLLACQSSAHLLL